MNKQKLSAIVVCIILAFIAQYLGSLQAFIGAPMIAMLLGMFIVNTISVDADFQKGTSWAGKKFLNLGIILTGATLSFQQILGVGAKALPLLVFNIVLAFAVSNYVGKKMKVSENTANLVGGGTSICGGTAIASIASVINASSVEIAYAMTAIFLMDVVAAILFPYLAVGLNLTVNQAGFLMGAAVNDTSSVTAAEATYSTLIGSETELGMTIKMARTVLLIGVVVYLSLKQMKRNPNAQTETKPSILSLIAKTIPTFIVIFLVMALLNTVGVFSFLENILAVELIPIFKKLSKFAIAVALAGVGFKVRFAELFSEGRKPVILGTITWLAVFASTMLFIYIFAGYVG